MLTIYNKSDALHHLKQLPEHASAEPNIYNHPAFLHPALTHLADDNCALLQAQNEQSLFLLPFQTRRAGLGLRKTINGWGNVYATQGTPLLIADHLDEMLDSLVSALGNPQSPLPDTMLLSNINLDAPFAKALSQVVEVRKLPLHILHPHQRPVLFSNANPENYLTQAIGKNHLREYRRQWRRLSENGDLQYAIIEDHQDILDAFEVFLQVEAAGWKGKAGTAFLNKSHDTAFARDVVNNLAQQAKIRIHQLVLDKRTIASLVVFYDGDQAWTWKTAYDEQYRAFSPGVLLMIELVKTHLNNPAIRITDSCAIPDHPVMTRLFQGRHTFATLVLGLSTQSADSALKIRDQVQRYDYLYNKMRSLRNKLCSIIKRS